jgi:GT2 family glycosyltransferase
LFYAGEELEFGYRVVKSGGHFLFVDDIKVLHESTPVARPSGQHTYFFLRNRSLIALKHLPMPFVLSHLILWWIYLAVEAGRIRSVGSYINGVRDFFKLAPLVIRERSALKISDLNILSKLRGRILY